MMEERINELFSKNNNETYNLWIDKGISNGIEYECIYNVKSNNNYLYLKPYEKQHGVYMFVARDMKSVLYVGKADIQTLSQRIKQHFNDKDTGGLRTKLKGIQINKLNDSILYVICMGDKKADRNISFLECYLIAKFMPEFNF